MQTHHTGAIKGNRLGADIVKHTFQLDITNNLTGVDLLLLTLPAGSAIPVPISFTVRAVVMVADDSATSAVLRVGTTSGGTDLLNDVDIKAAAGTNYVPTNAESVAVVETPIYARITRVGTPTVGKVLVIVNVADVNVNQPTAQGS